MKHQVIACATTLLCGLCSVNAGDIINGHFEDTSLEHPEWRVSARHPNQSVRVVGDPVTGCSFVRIAYLDESNPDRASLTQEGLQFCESEGGYATIQFDVRTFGGSPQEIHAVFGGVDWDLPMTNGMWEQHRISVPFGVANASAIEFAVYNLQQGTCLMGNGMSLDIDNVICFESNIDLSTLPQIMPISCPISFLLDTGVLMGHGGGCVIECLRCPADLDDDCVVGLSDLTTVLANFGQFVCIGCGCAGDVNGDGVIDYDDILNVIANWGACPGSP